MMITILYISIITITAAISVYLHLQNKDLKHSVSILSSSIDKEKQKEQQNQSLLATITHDLKTPTNAQINILNLLLKENFGKLNSEQKEMLTLTQNSCQYMSDLIAIIMDTYNWDYGGIQLKPDRFDIINLIENQCQSLEHLSKQHNQKIIFHSKYKTLPIFADKLQIKRVILNLLSNAITYSFSNSKINVLIKKEPKYFEFIVENQSQPIPENELETVFDKFKKTKYSQFNKAGNGLGLYLSKQIIEQHHGEIYAKSSKDGKCVFGFKIPDSNIAELAAIKVADN